MGGGITELVTVVHVHAMPEHIANSRKIVKEQHAPHIIIGGLLVLEVTRNGVIGFSDLLF